MYAIRSYYDERGIPVPARHELDVQMRRDARPGGLAEVDAHVDALGPQDLVHDGHAKLHGPHMFGGLIGGQIRHAADVAVGRDHEMAAIVREFVHVV